LQISNSSVEVWARPISPPGSFAIAFLQLANNGTPESVNVIARDVGLSSASSYSVTDGFNGESIGTFGPDTVIKVIVNPNGVVLIRAQPI